MLHSRDTTIIIIIIIKRKLNHVVFSRVTILSFHSVHLGCRQWYFAWFLRKFRVVQHHTPLPQQTLSDMISLWYTIHFTQHRKKNGKLKWLLIYLDDYWQLSAHLMGFCKRDIYKVIDGDVYLKTNICIYKPLQYVHIYPNIYIYIYICLCVCVCVCDTLLHRSFLMSNRNITRKEKILFPKNTY